MPLLLAESDVRSLLDTRARMEWIDLMERTLADFSAGRVRQPVRTALRMPEHDSLFAVMPGVLAGASAAGLKVVSLAPRNAALGKPTHLATVLLLDPATGALLALMDGRLITERRTAAVSAAAARALARKDAATLALLGSGVQAASHLEAFREVFALADVRVWSATAGHRDAFANREGAGVPVRACADAEQAVRGADLVVTATSAREPVLRGEWLEPGCHVTSVGACVADWRELDGAAVARARVFVDSLEAARVEAGDLIGAQRDGLWSFEEAAGEIGAVFAGTLPGRTSPEQVTLFKSLGLACEDVASGAWLLARARERGVGRDVAL